MIEPIQYLRALAALMVVWHHALDQVPGNATLIKVPEFGLSGVDIFFVISGFIMLVTTTQKPLSPRKFFELRIVRVVPLYWVMTLALIASAFVAPGTFRTLRLSVLAVAKSLLFIPYDSLSFPGNAWPVLVPGWTLNYEMFFYLIFALVLFIPIRWRLASLLATMACLVIAGKIIGPSQSPFVWVYTDPLLLEFGAGALIGYLWVRNALQLPLIASGLAIAAGSYLLVFRDSPPFMSYSQKLGAVLVVGGCLHPTLRALRSPVLLALGDASYSIYLTHIFTLGALRVVWLHLVPRVTLESAIAFMIVAMIACAIAGSVGCRWIEKPLIAHLRRAVEHPGVKAA
jgi:exopolysaccharide production protein ExoZ